jgi:hypothetical protein|eukprot:COSAG06_NODE_4275_length_4411_cov_13.319290_2_plen_81_part_00
MTTPEMIAHHFIAARLSGAHITDPAALPTVDSLDHAYEIQKVQRMPSLIAPHRRAAAVRPPTSPTRTCSQQRQPGTQEPL